MQKGTDCVLQQLLSQVCVHLSVSKGISSLQGSVRTRKNKESVKSGALLHENIQYLLLAH